jgi:SAM-dependent methyltransferase
MKEQIEPLFTGLGENQELELSFYEYLESANKNVPLGYRTYRQLVAHAARVARKKKLELRRETVFDFALEADNNEYRLSITGIETINRLLKIVHRLNNYVAARVLLKRFADSLPEDVGTMTLLHKTRTSRTELEAMSGRLRLANERKVSTSEALQISKTLGPGAGNSIIFRYKQRISLELSDEDGIREGFDLTAVKQGRDIGRMENSTETYEAELELMRHGTGKNRSKTLEHFVDTANEIYQVIDNTDLPMERKPRDEVLAAYRKLTGSERPTLEVRNAISMQLYHATNVVANKYGALDKAEGERYVGIVHDGHLYLISNNLHVRDSGLQMDAEWNGTIIDGEFIIEHRLFLPFDTMFLKGKDVRENPSLRDRMAMIDEIVKILLPDGCILNKKNGAYTGDMELSKLIEHYTAYATEHYRVVKYNMKHMPKSGILVQKKLCLIPHGVHDSEIFCYMHIIWSLYEADLIPYILDGVILTPLLQKYVTKRGEATLQELKWKPEDKNSIDFYLRFVRDDSTGKIMTLFNNCRDDELKGKPYRIAYLYVGGRDRGEETPVQFMPEKKLYMVHLYLENGEIRDMEGNPIRDGTVIEAFYKDDPSISPLARWTIMRTRWDKTESVMRYKRRYGNNEEIARNVWTSIQTPFKASDIALLAKMKSYVKHMDSLKSRITSAMAIQLAKETSYYAKQTKLMEAQRNFHNFIKSIIMYPYLNPRYNMPQRMAVLDIGCGRGGDLPKLFYSRVTMAVGIDPDFENINSVVRGCINTYKQMRRTRENVPPMYFLQASAIVPFTASAQRAALGNMTPDSLAGIKRFFEGNEKQPPMKFDAINCQFALHYMFNNETGFSNFCDNINNTLRPGGWFLATCFDADLVMEALGKDGKHILPYTDENGVRKSLHEITKKFELTDAEQKNATKNGYGVGCAIDVYNASFMNEGSPQTEYLVDKKFITREFSKRCGLEIVETGLFSMLYKTNKEFFRTVAPWEANDPTYLLKVRRYYGLDTENDRLSYEITRLNRYYIFQKTGTADELKEVSKTKGPERKVPLKTTKTVPKEETSTKKSNTKKKPQKGGKSRKEDRSEDDSSSSEEEDEKSRKASRGLSKDTKAKRTHIPKEAEDADRRIEAEANGKKKRKADDNEDEDSSSDEEDISDIEITEEDPDVGDV